MKYDTEMRLPYIDPNGELTEEQKKFYDLNLYHMETMPYIWLTENKELNGPSNMMLHEAEIGNMFFPLNRKIIKNSIEAVGGAAHEIAILITVTSAKAQYGMYAHTMLARKFGLSDSKINAIMAGVKPSDLTEVESAVYDLANALCNQVGAVAGSVYDNAVKVLGQKGVNAICFAVGNFKMVGTILNTYNEPVPEYRK